MHEFILYSQVPGSRYSQVLNILAGVTASQPVNVSEQTLVYQQLKVTEPTGPRKGQTNKGPQTQRLSNHKLVRDLGSGDEVSSWRLRVEEVPEAGVKLVTSRSVLERDSTGADLERFWPNSGWYQ